MQNRNAATLASAERAVEVDPRPAAAYLSLSLARQAGFDLDAALAARKSRRTAAGQCSGAGTGKQPAAEHGALAGSGQAAQRFGERIGRRDGRTVYGDSCSWRIIGLAESHGVLKRHRPGSTLDTANWVSDWRCSGITRTPQHGGHAQATLQAARCAITIISARRFALKSG